MEVTDIVLGILTVVSGYLAIAHFLDKYRNAHENDRVDQTKENSALELKVKELEGRIASQYSELSQKLANVERALADDKVSKLTFEARVLGVLDKTDSKMERIQDLILSVIMKNQK